MSPEFGLPVRWPGGTIPPRLATVALTATQCVLKALSLTRYRLLAFGNGLVGNVVQVIPGWPGPRSPYHAYIVHHVLCMARWETQDRGDIGRRLAAGESAFAMKRNPQNPPKRPISRSRRTRILPAGARSYWGARRGRRRLPPRLPRREGCPSSYLAKRQERLRDVGSVSGRIFA